MNTGVVCGATGWVGKTSNGGLSWDSCLSNTTSTLYGVHFINSSTGFACGTNGAVIKSTDVGATWTVLATGVTTSLYNIYPVDINNIFVATSSNNVMVTTNGGVNWSTYATGGLHYTILISLMHLPVLYAVPPAGSDTRTTGV